METCNYLYLKKTIAEPHIQNCPNKMKSFIFLTCICVENKNETTEKPISEVQGSDSTHGSSVKDPNHFLPFWESFRKAVIDNDTIKIAGYTDFPFETRSPADADEVVVYTKKQFVKVFGFFLRQPSGIHSEITELEDIKKTPVPSKKDLSADNVRVGDLVFEYNGKEWKLTFAFLEYSTINEINKTVKESVKQI
jgi:hypothetical protein